MKTLIFSFFCCIHIGFAQTTKQPLKPKYMTEAQVIELIKQLRPTINIDSLFRDTDGDGVIDRLDRQANTPKDCPVDARGETTDSDGDGVIDCDDKEPYTLPGYPTDPNGVATKIIFCGDPCETYRHCNKTEWIFTPLYFNKKSYKLNGQTQADLKGIARILTKNPIFCVAIEGYTDDNLDSADDNARLSFQRAKQVADYLSTNYGVAADRLKIKIKGEENIIKGDRSEKNIDRYNRRVEIVIVECREVSDEAPK